MWRVPLKSRRDILRRLGERLFVPLQARGSRLFERLRDGLGCVVPEECSQRLKEWRLAHLALLLLFGEEFKHLISHPLHRLAMLVVLFEG